MSAWALGEMEARGSTNALAAAIRGDADDRVRETAVWALGEIGERSSVDVLGWAISNDKSARVRGTAAWAIGQFDDDDGVKAPEGLIRLLKDESEDTRLKAAWAAIRDALRIEKTNSVRRALIRAMVKSGESSRAALTELLTSTDPQVRDAAVRGLAGRDAFGPWPWPWPRPRPMP
jgi:HEAT repeat protein